MVAAGITVISAPSHAAAAVTFKTAAFPSTFAYPAAVELRYRIEMTTGPGSERFGLTFAAPRYGRIGPRAEGSPIEPEEGDGRFSFAGPGSLGDLYRLGRGTPACSPRMNLYHGYEPTAQTVDVSLPPNSTSVLTARYRTGGFAPWPGLTFAPTVIAETRLLNGTRGTLRRRQVVSVPSPRLKANRTGVRIEFFTTPRSSPSPGYVNVETIERGQPISVYGHIEPRMPRQRVLLRYFEPGARRLRTLAVVRTSRRGHFRFRGWRPRKRGSYELWAFYPRQRQSLLSDHACPREFVVRERG